jgi:DNA repair ATPase RecN
MLEKYHDSYGDQKLEIIKEISRENSNLTEEYKRMAEEKSIAEQNLEKKKDKIVMTKKILEKYEVTIERLH